MKFPACLKKLLGLCFTFRSSRKNLVQEATWSTSIAFIPPVTGGKVVKVYDGDTITIVTTLPYDRNLYRFSVRLKGIDCPELKGTSGRERERALKAKALVEELVSGKMVVLQNVSLEKYGRLLADVYVDGVWVNSLLLKKRLAVEYNGKAKVPAGFWETFE
jgi:endonuclease YncB( thermonuclease family)